MENKHVEYHQSAFACLFMLWLPALQAADSGWLQEPANDHAKVRLRADTSQPGETRLLLAVELQKGWKTYWRSPGEGGIAPAIAWQATRRRRYGIGRRRSASRLPALPLRVITIASACR